MPQSVSLSPSQDGVSRARHGRGRRLSLNGGLCCRVRYLGMSLEALLNTYGHHHPDYLSDAVEKIVQRHPAERKRDVSGAITGAVIKLPRGKRS